MNSINAIHTAIRQRIEIRENIIRIDKRIILSTLRTRTIIASTDAADTAILLTDHRQSPNRVNPATLKPNFMMIPEAREFCFNMFFSFLITMTFFFMRHPSCRSFLFHRATKGMIVFQNGDVFCVINTLAARGKRKICHENLKGCEHTWLKHYHTFALMNNRPNKECTRQTWNSSGRNAKGHR